MEQLLAAERARAKARLGRSVERLGDELGGVIEQSPLGRHPLVGAGVALGLGLVCGPSVLRGVGGALRVSTSLAGSVALLLVGLARRL